MRLGASSDIELQRIASRDPARRMNDDHVADIRALRVQRPLDDERPQVPA